MAAIAHSGDCVSGPIFARLQPGYAKLWAELEVAPEHAAAVKTICTRQLAHKATFQQVEQATGVPWWWVAITDQMEGGGGASTFLGNGQSLSRITTEVPAGEGPFANFVAGAVRAIHLDGVDAPATWSVEYAAFRWEGFNGWGYLHLRMEDPYLAAWSNKESSGKYVADHVFDPNARSGQPGALTILKVLVQLDPSIDLTGGANQGSTTVSTAPPVALPPIDFKTLVPVVDQILPFVFKLVPQLAPFEVPLTSLAHDLLNAVPGSDPHALLSIFVKDGIPLIGVFAPQVTPFLPMISGLASMLLNATPPVPAT